MIMETLIIYLAKTSGLMAIFYAAYYTLLRKETFFTANRRFLIAGLITAAVLPLMVYTKIIWVNPAPQLLMSNLNINQLLLKHHYVAPQEQPAFEISWWYVTAGIYGAGILFFSIRFIADLFKVRKMLKGQPIAKEGRFKLIDAPTIPSPFSFFNYIVYNSATLQPGELTSILSHEKVHSSQKHSFDVLLAQLFCIAFWFNPVAWLYKKAISQNLEFIADEGALKSIEDKIAYQKTLLKITVQPDCIAITNHFYQSLIKKRIVMLNKQKSSRKNSWKYAIIIPALAAFMFLFQYKVIAQEKEPAIVTADYIKFVVEITKDTKDSELQEQSKLLKKEYGADVTFSNITRNSKKEITGIKVTIKENGRSAVQESTGSNPITPFTLEVEKDSNGTRTAIANNNGSMHIKPGYPAPPAAPAFIAPDAPASPPAPPAAPVPVNGRAMLLNQNNSNQGGPLFNFGNSDALVVINGVKQSKDQVVMLPGGQKIVRITTLDKKEAKKKYGKEAKKGAIEITTATIGAQSFSFTMPDIDQPAIRFAQGMNEGFRVLASVDFKKEISDAFSSVSSDELSGMSDEEVEAFQENLKQAQAEIQRAGPELQKQFAKQRLSREDVDDAKKEIEEARKEIEQAKKEIIKAQKEIERTKKQAGKKV